MRVKGRPAVILALAGSVLGSLLSTPVASQDPLWMKAVARKDTGRVWIAGKMVMREEEIDGKGVTKSSREQWMEARDRGDGSFTYETFKIVEDGKDVTEDEMASAQDEVEGVQGESRERPESEQKNEDQQEGNREEDSLSYTFSSPDIFDSEVQERVRVKALGERKVIGGRNCVGYDFVTERDQKTYRETLTGVAWLEEQTGIPVEVKYTARPLPKRVKRAETVVHYQVAADGSFYTVDIVTEVTGGLLFLKKRFRVTLEFLEYRELKEEQ